MATLAEMQLHAWQELARNWPVSHDAQFSDAQAISRRDRAYRCGVCGAGVALAYDLADRRYTYTAEQWLALVVLHLRNHHANLDPDR